MHASTEYLLNNNQAMISYDLKMLTTQLKYSLQSTPKETLYIFIYLYSEPVTIFCHIFRIYTHFSTDANRGELCYIYFNKNYNRL